MVSYIMLIIFVLWYRWVRSGKEAIESIIKKLHTCSLYKTTVTVGVAWWYGTYINILITHTDIAILIYVFMIYCYCRNMLLVCANV